MFLSALGRDRRFPPELGGFVDEPPIAAQPIDRPVARRGRDPRPGIRGQAIDRPALEGGDERVLNGLFGSVKVARHADQRRDRAPRFLAEDAPDNLG